MMNVMNKLKQWFFKKPSDSFWKSACLTMLVFAIITPKMLPFLAIFQVGLLMPEAQIDYDELSQKVARQFISPLGRMHTAGTNVANNNPTIAIIAFYCISSFIYSIYIAMFITLFHLSRYGFAYIIKKAKGGSD